MLIVLLLSGGAPAAFSAHPSDLLGAAPPDLQVGGRGFWNDPATRSFGMIELGDGLYVHAGQPCKVATSTVIDAASGRAGSDGFLYCPAAANAWRMQPGIMCRLTNTAGSATCRDPDGSYFTMASIRR